MAGGKEGMQAFSSPQNQGKDGKEGCLTRRNRAGDIEGTRRVDPPSSHRNRGEVTVKRSDRERKEENSQ